MGARIVLHDDGSTVVPVVTTVDEDCCAAVAGPVEEPVDVPVGPEAVLRSRTRVGYDQDGVPLFEWTSLAEGPLLATEVREEFDPDHGMTVRVLTGSMQVPGTDPLPETMALLTASGQWRVTQTTRTPGMVRVRAERISQEPLGGVGS